MLVVGLTGGIATGKTTVSHVLRDEGACVIDADRVAQDLVQPEMPAWKELVRAFGTEILEADGSIHRKRLATVVFSNPCQRALLNQILHPRIRAEISRRVTEIAEKNPEAIVVVDAALLVETGYYREMDRLIVVTSTETQQIERMKKRVGFDEEQARKILASQMGTEEKVRVADHVIQNEGSFEEVKQKAKEVFQELKHLAAQKKGFRRSGGDNAPTS